MSGYSGADIAEYKQPGSNGLALDPQGRLTINEHGNRRVTRLERDGRVTVLADRLYLCARDRLYRMRLNVGGRQASTLGSH